MTRILIIAGLGLLIVLGILIGRGVKEIRALEDEQRAAAAKEHKLPQECAGTKVLRRSEFE